MQPSLVLVSASLSPPVLETHFNNVLASEIFDRLCCEIQAVQASDPVELPVDETVRADEAEGCNHETEDSASDLAQHLDPRISAAAAPVVMGVGHDAQRLPEAVQHDDPLPALSGADERLERERSDDLQPDDALGLHVADQGREGTFAYRPGDPQEEAFPDRREFVGQLPLGTWQQPAAMASVHPDAARLDGTLAPEHHLIGKAGELEASGTGVTMRAQLGLGRDWGNRAELPADDDPAGRLDPAKAPETMTEMSARMGTHMQRLVAKATPVAATIPAALPRSVIPIPQWDPVPVDRRDAPRVADGLPPIDLAVCPAADPVVAVLRQDAGAAVIPPAVTMVATSGSPAIDPGARAVRSTAPIHRQIADAVVNSKDGVVEIILAPNELGRMKMVITRDEHFTRLHVIAERPETMDLMRRHADLLARDLRDSGVGQSDISFAASDGREQSSQGRASGGHAAPPPPRDQTTSRELPDVPTGPAKPQMWGDRRIDIRI